MEQKLAQEVAGQLLIKIQCPDEVGLIQRISRVLYEHSLNIVSLQEHVEKQEQYFFSRIIVAPLAGLHISLNTEKLLIEQLEDVLPEFARVSLHREEKKNIVIMVSKEYHCLGELILRTKYANFSANILAVVGNHDNDIRELCDFAQIPFHYVPSLKEMPREEHETEVRQILAQYEYMDYIVLAKYMRILSQSFTDYFRDKIINIHHSFLPAFIGANPYKQARDRGVKLIGATAHYVNEGLDEGPIIAQQVLPIDHSMSVEELRHMGQDIEKLTLAHALNLVFTDKVFVCNNRTIILQ